jgi:uncharacterized Zn finger protein
MNSFSLQDIVTETWLRARAGKRRFDDGGAYYHAGTVQKIDETASRICARVEGASVYDAAIWLENGSPRFMCTCEEAQPGLFCKHLVALGLTWRAGQRHQGTAGTFSGYPELKLLETYLTSLDQASLVDLLLGEASGNPGLRQRLMEQATRRGDGHGELIQVALRKSIQRWKNWTAVERLAADIETTASMLRAAWEGGHADIASALSSEALNRATAVIGVKNDPSGVLAAGLEKLRQTHIDVHGSSPT